MALSMGQNVLVDFYAPWCKACVIFAPKYQNAVQEAVKNGLDVTFAKVDTDQNPYLTQRFGVNTFPRLLLFPRSGARPKRYTLFFIMNYKFLTTETNSKALNIFRCFLTQPHQ